MRGKNASVVSVLLPLYFFVAANVFANDAARAMLQRLRITCDANELQKRVERGDTKTVRLLLKAGIPVDTEAAFGITPLMVASEKGFSDLIKTLLEFGARVDARDQLWSHTSLMRAAEAGQLAAL